MLILLPVGIRVNDKCKYAVTVWELRYGHFPQGSEENHE